MYGGGINMLKQQPYSDIGTMIQDRMDNGVIITLRGTDNIAQISIPQLQKQFATAGVGDEVQFIVKSFSFHTEFVNMKKGDGFNFWLTELDYQPDNDTNLAPYHHDFDTGNEPFSVPLIFDSDFDEIHVTTDEFVNILNASKLFALRLFASHTPKNTPPDQDAFMSFNCFNILQHCEFVYDYTVGKIGLKVDLVGRVPQFYYDNALNRPHSIRTFQLLMQPFNQLSALNQYRLAQLMGFGSNVKHHAIGDEATALYEYTYSSPLMETYLYRPIGVDILFYPPNAQQQITLFSPYVSDNLPNKFVIIRSSARSNVISDKGKREGILLSIAVTQSSIETYQTFNEDRLDFASKDTLQGVKAMSLEIVDEFGQPLTFRTPYELKIGVYFK